MDQPGPSKAPERLTSADAYRGLVMFLMMAEALHFGQLARRFPESRFWAFLSLHQSHVEWIGCTLHDLIQPSFSFLVGVALPYSIAARLARGQSRVRMTVHALWRAFLLVMLGVFLRSQGQPQTNFTFEDTLSQIGLGYVFLFVLGFRPVREQWAALLVILVGYWAAFAWYRGSGTGAGVPADWPHWLTGFPAHWNKNDNPAWAFDVWFLNLLPRRSPFRFNGGGYSTLSFIPTLGTMILGLVAGGVLRSDRPAWGKARWLAMAGVIALAAGYALGVLGICPIVKRIWTPSWVLFSGGFCFLFLASFYSVIDLLGWRRWAFPLIVIGMNSIAAYCMAGMIEGFVAQSLRIHLGPEAFKVFGPEYATLVQGASVLLVLWLILYWMYRKRIFVRI